MGQETLGEVQDGSGDTREDLGRVWGHSGMFGTYQGTIGKVRVVSADSRRGPGRVGGH